MSVLEKRRLLTHRFDTALCLSARREIVDGVHHATLTFSEQTDPDVLFAYESTQEVSRHTLINAPVLKFVTPSAGPIPLYISGKLVEIAPDVPECDLFAGLNVGLAIRNHETPEIAAQWLEFHQKYHGMDAALIVDRSRDDRFADALAAILPEGLSRVVVLRPDMPLGNPKMPNETHPYCAPGAPGKDRMKVPSPDPQRSPLGEFAIYEVLRWQFLNDAKAVMNIDLSDLIFQQDTSIFATAQADPTGLVHLLQRRAYPWRVREGDVPSFGDHLCVQFDSKVKGAHWCIAPHKLPQDLPWRPSRIGKIQSETMVEYYRFMGLRHPNRAIAKIVPKTSLIEDEVLLQAAKNEFDHKPVRMPDQGIRKPKNNRRAIITTMKNEGPFILEWIAYHKAIGFTDFLVYTNDCTDGTTELLDLLADKGIIEHLDNPFKSTDLKPQHAALQDGEVRPIIKNAQWAICMDVDEYVNIKVGDGTLDALFEAVGDANMISLTWRMFGNNDVDTYRDSFIIEQFTRCAQEFANKPHQAWGFKTLFQNIGLFNKMGVHRPKGLKGQLWEEVKWVNGSGKPLPRKMYRNAWRSTSSTYGYDLVQLNHYAVRSTDSFLVKRDRGRVNHVDRDQGLAYWFRMNNNAVEETSIHARLPMLQKAYDALMADPKIKAAHDFCVTKHLEKIAELKKVDENLGFFNNLAGIRLKKLSRMHHHFGANVFLQGPDSVPDEVVEKDPNADFFFTVEAGETKH